MCLGFRFYSRSSHNQLGAKSRLASQLSSGFYFRVGHAVHVVMAVVEVYFNLRFYLRLSHDQLDLEPLIIYLLLAGWLDGL